MAEGKKSVLLYCDIIHTVEKLDNATAGELFKHYLRYVNDLNPSTGNPIVDLVFEPIKQQLKRDLEKWDMKKEEKSNNGRMGNLKRYNLDLYNKVTIGDIGLEEAENLAKSRKVSPSEVSDRNSSQLIAKLAVTDTVTVNVIDTVKDIVLKDNSIVDKSTERSYKKLSEEEFLKSLAPFTKKLGGVYEPDMVRSFANYWTEKNSKGQMRFQIEKTWETAKRLSTWYSRSLDSKKTKTQPTQIKAIRDTKSIL